MSYEDIKLPLNASFVSPPIDNKLYNIFLWTLYIFLLSDVNTSETIVYIYRKKIYIPLRNKLAC